MGRKSDKRMLFESDSIVLAHNLDIEPIPIHTQLGGDRNNKQKQN